MRLIDAHSISMQIVELYNGEKDEKVKSTMREIMKLIRESPTVPFPPSSDPLTLDELWEMEGEPVWCVDGSGSQCWGLVNCNSDEFPCCLDNETGYWDGRDYEMTGNGKFGLHEMGWRAYRRKPEGCTP